MHEQSMGYLETIFSGLTLLNGGQCRDLSPHGSTHKSDTVVYLSIAACAMDAMVWSVDNADQYITDDDQNKPANIT